jgi:proteasome lid subunit RPN8/RPN11
VASLNLWEHCLLTGELSFRVHSCSGGFTVGSLEEVRIPDDLLRGMMAHAEQEYPRECCGMLLAEMNDPSRLRLRECTNSQDRFHELDPSRFPRTSANAYYFAPSDLLAVEREIRERREVLHAICHSHIDADAYFSEEDIRQAVVDGEAVYPAVVQLVIPVREGVAGLPAAFMWEADSKEYVERCLKPDRSEGSTGRR